MNKRLAPLFTVLTLAFMLGASAIARHGTASGVSSAGYPALSSAENTLCRVEHGAVQINVNAADEDNVHQVILEQTSSCLQNTSVRTLCENDSSALCLQSSNQILKHWFSLQK